MQAHFIAVGDVMVDVAVTGRGHDARARLAEGGSAANAAAWAAALGARAAVAGRIGFDAAGRLLTAGLAARGVEALLALDDELPTGTVLELEGELRVDRGANRAFAPADVPDPLAAGAVLVSGYALLQEGSRAGARAALGRAQAPWLALDAASPGLVRATGPERFHELATGASVLLANEAEARELTGRQPEEAARELGERYRLACVKRGAQGALAVLDGELLTAPSPHVDRATPLGAGDAFAAGLLVGLARGSNPPEALELACRCGALAAGRHDSWPALPLAPIG